MLPVPLVDRLRVCDTGVNAEDFLHLYRLLTFVFHDQVLARLIDRCIIPNC